MDTFSRPKETPGTQSAKRKRSDVAEPVSSNNRELSIKKRRLAEQQANDSLVAACGGKFVPKEIKDAWFDHPQQKDWDTLYKQVLSPKYQKHTRAFSRILPDKRFDVSNGKRPPIYLIPRERGGPSYKSVALQGAEPEELFFAPISGGFGMQDVSSKVLGPLPGEGLCLVNSAFSKVIYTFHLEGGTVTPTRKTFWKPHRNRDRLVEMCQDGIHMLVDGKQVVTLDWLKENESLWLPSWEQWRRLVCLASEGDFHWGGGADVVSYRNAQGEYLDFVQWKIQCYIRPSYSMMDQEPAFQFLQQAWTEGVALGLVHPKAQQGLEKPITKEFLEELFLSPTRMCCQPYVVAAKLLGVLV